MTESYLKLEQEAVIFYYYHFKNIYCRLEFGAGKPQKSKSCLKHSCSRAEIGCGINWGTDNYKILIVELIVVTVQPRSRKKVD